MSWPEAAVAIVAIIGFVSYYIYVMGKWTR